MNVSLSFQYFKWTTIFLKYSIKEEWYIPYFFLNKFYNFLSNFNDFSLGPLFFLGLYQLTIVSDQGFFELRRFLIRKELHLLFKEVKFLFLNNSAYKNFSVWHNYKWYYEKENFPMLCFPIKTISRIFLAEPKNIHFHDFFQFLLYQTMFFFWERLIFIEILNLNDFVGNPVWILKSNVFFRSKIISSDIFHFLSGKKYYSFSQSILDLIENILNRFKIKNGFSLSGLGFLILEKKKLPFSFKYNIFPND
mmetsp:Transcript_15991/g.32856  ORF Transcript_15991/g.32856 Transcript_15991/m.32856 type:complete len:250 (+) Transcript_15991:52-801(+)